MTDSGSFLLPSERYGLPQTDLTRWRLATDEFGRQVWQYLQDGDDEPDATSFVKHQLGLPGFKSNPVKIAADGRKLSAHDAAYNAFAFLSTLQDSSGIFPCQYGGPMFMLIGYVVAKYFTDTPFSEEERVEICRYLVNRAHPVDGGWGLHSYDKSTAFGTTINYVILRILGMPRDHPAIVKARKTLRALGGAIGNPHWGKAYLAILNLYGWEGVNPAPPELWSLPYAVPIHPGRWWVHTRAIYLPLSYLSSNRVKLPLNPLLRELREEIYTGPYDSIDFSSHRDTVCGVDLYYPHSSVLNVINRVLVFYEKHIRPDWLLKYSNKYVAELVEKDLENTDHLAIAPVSNAMNALVMYITHGRESPLFQRFLFRWSDFKYMSKEGMFMCGTNGVQVWDVAFALQYCVVAGLAEYPEFKDTLIRGYRFLLRSQFTENCVEGSYRDTRKGGFPFSTKIQGFTVSDCTAEAVKAILMVQNLPGFEFLKDEILSQNLYDAIDVLISIQNKGVFHYGSFASYEKIKGPEFLELLNPAEVFGNIMIEYPYVECTDSSVLGLVYFRKYSDYRADEIDEAIAIALDYIISYQNPDGSWYGSWGVCYTYAGMFAVEALQTQGYNYENFPVVKRACDFIVKHQELDGGWAESFRSCELHTYVRDTESQVVQTAWAAIMLLLAEYPDRSIISRAIDFLISKQNSDGSYSWNHVEGVFNHSW
ncbi:lanosterol synthase ERG7 [Sugiyamaella lignohabitans]|uniref:Terpene cyclase/mutase family member n=1 Tax=Sugiyamaella lignohabitans TaxID=796027 RepID=A0A167FSM5_9ASCO|nr:lanosterol synthase ERG7 [Sugiyamaella lignohabitans]ANB15652.1 lanosterol synthase ERG7 [Sugiyamaella lignohabitans]